MKARPYVYKLTHKSTGQYYFGFRCANKLPALQDIGVRYFTSSRTIKEMGFENFIIEILAEFDNKQAAFDHETSLIAEHIGDPSNLNKALNGTLCPIRKFTTSQHRANLSKSLRGKTYPNRPKFSDQMTEEQRKEKWGESGHRGGKAAQVTIANMSPEERKQKFGSFTGKSHTPETVNILRLKNTGKKMSDDSRKKMSLAKLGKKQPAHQVEQRSRRMSGGKNPMAIVVEIHGVTYSTKKEAMEALGWSRLQLNAYLKTIKS